MEATTTYSRSSICIIIEGAFQEQTFLLLILPYISKEKILTSLKDDEFNEVSFQIRVRDVSEDMSEN
jgi:hypothetical protein